MLNGKFFAIACLAILCCFSGSSQSPIHSDSILLRFQIALSQIGELAREKDPLGFKKAVFLTENAYLEGSLDYSAFAIKIRQMTALMKAWTESNSLKSYRYEDSLNFKKNFSIFTIMKDSIKVINTKNGQAFSTIPMVYDFDDYDGAKDWTKMFVSKLLFTYSGNCHSLPYLYKILADDLGALCWLSLSPNHLYIQNRCKKIGWYNTELTSGCFPVDAWIMASGYLPLKAVQSGIYMDTLSNQNAVALCMLDLAKGYEHKTHNYYDGFILKCCDTSLRYFPLNVQAMLLKAETFKHLYQRQKERGESQAKATFSKMQSLYLDLFDLGYREMPDQMYMQWLQSVVKEHDKYTNKQIRTAISDN